MAEFGSAVITDAGATLLARVMAGSKQMEFTALTVGDGTYSAADKTVVAMQAMTALKNQRLSFPFSSVTPYSSTSVCLKAVVSNISVTSGFYINEVGIWAKDASDALASPILYSIVAANTADYLPAYNGSTPSTIQQDWYTTLSNTATATISVSSSAYALAEDLADQVAKEAAFETAQAAETEAAWDGINRIMLPGRDLTVVFADEIANYSDEWAWIQARLDAHDVSGLRVGDYIPINIAANGGIAAETHKVEIAGINTYRRTGDNGHAVGYHIDWITRDCYSQTVQFNTTSNNNGNASNSSPFLASNLKSWLDGTLYPLLDAKLKNVIKAKRILAPYRYQSGATLTDDNSWQWEDFDKLWVPLETEIFDSPVWSTKGFGTGQAVQYPIFANSYEHRMKGVGPGGPSTTWWTASALSGNSTVVVNVNYYGSSNYSYASFALCVPVCFRTMEA